MHGRGSLGLDARGLMVLPGIVDLHGDAFERQMMPRPGVDFPVDVALVDSDRQAISNGITTVFHATTWSWEPGLRSGDNAQAIARGDREPAGRSSRRTPAFTCATRPTISMPKPKSANGCPVDASICSHSTTTWNPPLPSSPGRESARRWSSAAGFRTRNSIDLVERVVSRAHEVPGSIARLAEIARNANVRMLSHDDDSPEMREAFRGMGVDIAEFPVNEETARAAAEAGDAIVFGAPNVVRGGSHTGWTKAADMIAKGLCSVLASDYYYPAQLLAAFRLAADGVLPLAQAWDLISAAPARAAGLSDRGILAEGHRADIILVDDELPLRPRIVAVIAAGRLVHLTDASRLIRSSVGPARGGCGRVRRLYAA